MLLEAIILLIGFRYKEKVIKIGTEKFIIACKKIGRHDKIAAIIFNQYQQAFLHPTYETTL
jgi:hypothetical protein